MKRRSIPKLLVVVMAMSIVVAASCKETNRSTAPSSSTTANKAAKSPKNPPKRNRVRHPTQRVHISNPTLHEAFAKRRSDVVTTGIGRVERVLPNDLRGSRHQRFILDIGDGHTVLVAHNIDLAPPARVKRGTIVRFRGEYEYNKRGGVIHWTHRDPRKHRPGGWLEVDGKRYR